MIALLAAVILGSVAGYVNEPAVTLGDSIMTATERLGTPESASYELLTSREGPTHRDVRATLHYPGIEISVYVTLCCGRSQVESVTLTDPAAAARLEIDYPATAAEVHETLGVPSRAADGALEYRVESGSGPDTVRFELDHGRVKAIRWVYSIE